MCVLPLGSTYLSIQVIPAPLIYPSWTPNSYSIALFQPLVPFFCADIKDYFQNNLMSHFEYMKIPLRCFPQVIINQYNIIYSVKKDVFVYAKICKSIYSLKQGYFIYFDPLVKLLKPHGYYPLHSNPGIWCH